MNINTQYKRTLHFRTGRYLFFCLCLECTVRLGDKVFGVTWCWIFCAVLYRRGRFIKTESESYVLFCLRKKSQLKKDGKTGKPIKTGSQRRAKALKKQEWWASPGLELTYVYYSNVLVWHDTWYMIFQSCVYFRSAGSGYILWQWHVQRTRQYTTIHGMRGVRKQLQQEEQNTRQPSRMALNSSTAVQQSY